ncbi:hypothetical protein FLONG3_2417 [Fusarium longipes]|uniref:Myb-like domain-containing protein n=1 Tax=Fusarium longipes TaxID=694270 RepID=A0A395T4Q2_9HYPO|nr:hypothetical protein FLONG3_2417 [Fusarium longipes]
MSDFSTPKANAWTDEAKTELLLRIVAHLKPEGKGINWNEITMEGRTMKSLQNQWTAFNKRIEAIKQQSADAPAPPAKKTPGMISLFSYPSYSELTDNLTGRKRGPKPKTPKAVGSDEDDDDYGSPKKSTPRKRRAPKADADAETPESAAKVLKMEFNETAGVENVDFDGGI